VEQKGDLGRKALLFRSQLTIIAEHRNELTTLTWKQTWATYGLRCSTKRAVAEGIFTEECRHVNSHEGILLLYPFFATDTLLLFQKRPAQGFCYLNSLCMADGPCKLSMTNLRENWVQAHEQIWMGHERCCCFILPWSTFAEAVLKRAESRSSTPKHACSPAVPMEM
jgi:hypothetical protein